LSFYERAENNEKKLAKKKKMDFWAIIMVVAGAIMKDEDFEKRLKEIVEKLNSLHDDSNQTVGFVLICGYDEGKEKGGNINFRVAGGGDVTLLALMMYAAAKNDERYSAIFDAAVTLHEEKKSEELIPFKLRPTIDRAFIKGE